MNLIEPGTNCKVMNSTINYPKSIKAAWISDAGHGWLSVSNRDLAILKLNGISQCSYMNNRRSYLEEDADAAILFERLKELGIEPNVKATQPNWVERSFVRSLASFNEYWIENPIKEGSRVHIPSLNQDATVEGKVGSKIRIRTSVQVFAIPGSNPFSYIVPPVHTPSGVVNTAGMGMSL